MTSTGYTVMGWQVDPTTGNIKKDTVSALRVMQTSNLTSAPEATTQANVSGIIDKNDKDVLSDNGLVKTLTFFDNLGYSYTARFAMKSTGTDGKYTVELEKILNSDGTTFYDPETSKVGLSDIFGAKTTNATLGTYSQVQSGYYYDSASKKFYVGSDTKGTEITWNGTVFKDQAAGKTYSLKQVYGISDAMVDKIKGGATPAVDLKTGKADNYRRCN